jgi:Flp pilus assembly protein CpaB
VRAFTCGGCGLTVDVPRARQIARPSWINVRTALGALLFVVAFLGGLRVLDSARTTVSVWTAARDLPADAELETTDLSVAEVRLPSQLLDRYVLASTTLRGAVLTRPLGAGELIPSTGVAEEPAGPGRAMTIPVTPEQAVGSLVTVGARVDIFATFDAEDVRARTIPVVREAEVIDVVSASGLVANEASVVGVTVAVSPQEAARLAFATRTGVIDLARVVNSGSRDQARPVHAGDLG